jgi:hypothetical protein
MVLSKLLHLQRSVVICYDFGCDFDFAKASMAAKGEGPKVPKVNVIESVNDDYF